MSRMPRELHFSHDNTTYRATLMEEHVACGVIYEEACTICGYQLGNLAFYTTHPFVFCVHTWCLMASKAAPPPTNHETSRDISPPMYNETSRDIVSNPYRPPVNNFYQYPPYQPTLPPNYGNMYASNYSYYSYPPTVPNYAQPPYPPTNYVNYAQSPHPLPNVTNYLQPPNLQNHGHGNSASSSGGTHGVGGRLMGRLAVTMVGALLEALFQTMFS